MLDGLESAPITDGKIFNLGVSHMGEKDKNTEEKAQVSGTGIDADEKRRKALKKILAGSGTVVTAAAMQDKWAKPVVDSVVLPAHAQASGVAMRSSGVVAITNGSISDSDAQFAQSSILDTLIPAANAINGCILSGQCFDVSATTDSATVTMTDGNTATVGLSNGTGNGTLSPSGIPCTCTLDDANDPTKGGFLSLGDGCTGYGAPFGVDGSCTDVVSTTTSMPATSTGMPATSTGVPMTTTLGPR